MIGIREILFRGKRYMDDAWVDGSLFIDEKKEKHEILVGYVNYRVGFEANPETVGQFTGLTDKNGEKMYEGDVVRFGKFTYQVMYSSCRMGFYFSRLPRGGCVPGFTMTDWETLEIIGNIHDNPELLEVG